jgi:regulator of protease activity HflC (stomatin/prohibitin superfamily)
MDSKSPMVDSKASMLQGPSHAGLVPNVFNTGENASEGEGCLMTVMRYFLTFLCCIWAIFPFSWSSVLRTFNSYEEGVVFRLGVLDKEPRPAGLYFFLPTIDEVKVVDMRIKTYNIPPQAMMTKDSVTIQVTAAVLYRIVNSISSVCHVKDVHKATQQLAGTTLRAIVGESELDQVLHDRERISSRIQEVLDAATDPWGVQVTEVQVKDIILPQSMKRSMAAQAEAERERRGKLIAAKGELQASRTLVEAAQEMTTNPVTMQLRYMQTLTTIAQGKNSKVYFPLPISMSSLAEGSKLN